MSVSKTQLNLPNWEVESKSVDRIAAARAKANKTASNIIKNAPKTKELAEKFQALIDNMLSSGTIKSMEDLYQLTGVGNPNPTKAEREARLNVTGYAIVNGKNYFKLNKSNNVEAVRMLYMAGMSIKEIKSSLSSAKEGDIISVSCSKKINKFPKASYEDIIENNPEIRAYPAYLTTFDDYTYVVTTELGGNDANYYLQVTSSNNSDVSILRCKPAEFPLNPGTINITIKDKSYSISYNSSTTPEILIAQLKALIQINSLPIEVCYENGLVISSKYEFYFEESQGYIDLKIKDALYESLSSYQNGYSGVRLREGYEEPLNVVLKPSSYNKPNVLKFYQNLIDSGMSEDKASKILFGDSIYKEVPSKVEDLKNVFSSDDFDSILAYAENKSNSLYQEANTRVVSIDVVSIDKITAIEDDSLEYLLGHRLDITGISATTSNEEARDQIISNINNNSYSSLDTSNDNLDWLAAAQISSSATVYVERTKETEDIEWAAKTSEFLDGTLDWYSEEYFNANEFLSKYDIDTTYTYDVECLGTDLFASCDWNATYSVQNGLQIYDNNIASIDTTPWMEKIYMNEIILTIQAYMDAALASVKVVISYISNIITILNSPLTLGGFSGGLGLDMGSLLKCSLGADVSLAIPLYFPALNELIVDIVGDLTDGIEDLQEILDDLLCPLQNTINEITKSVSDIGLPCQVYFEVPLIPGIQGYLSAYISALAGLKAACNITKREADMVKSNVSKLPSKMDLIVTKSSGCSKWYYQ